MICFGAVDFRSLDKVTSVALNFRVSDSLAQQLIDPTGECWSVVLRKFSDIYLSQFREDIGYRRSINALPSYEYYLRTALERCRPGTEASPSHPALALIRPHAFGRYSMAVILVAAPDVGGIIETVANGKGALFGRACRVFETHAGDRAGRGMSCATTIDGGECYGGSEE